MLIMNIFSKLIVIIVSHLCSLISGVVGRMPTPCCWNFGTHSAQILADVEKYFSLLQGITGHGPQN